MLTNGTLTALFRRKRPADATASQPAIEEGALTPAAD
jgi:hypothetical protein